MFMVKGEFSNVKQLLKVKLKIERRNILVFSAVAVAIFLASLASTVFGIVRNDTPGLAYFNVMDFSGTFLFGVIFMYMLLMFMYRKINNVLSVFPQTNNSRFITAQIINYIFMTAVGLFALMYHLIYYGVIKLLSVFNDNIHLAIDFDIGFIIVGFFVYLAYAFLMIAVIELIGTVLRKWKYYAAVALTALGALAIINFMTVVEYVPRVLSFLIREPSVILFMLKAAAVWLVVVAVSLIINRFTVYHSNKGPVKTKQVVFICAAIAVTILIVLPLTIMHNTDNTTEAAVEVQPFEDFFHDFFAGASETRIDISHLPRGSNINFVPGENINHEAWAGGAATIMGRNQLAFVSGRDALVDIQGDTLIIQFRPPFFHINGFELTGHMNPTLNAYLVGDTLYMDYSFENARVVIMPIWGIARQFDTFRDRGLFTANLLGNSAGGNMTANVFISVE